MKKIFLILSIVFTLLYAILYLFFNKNPEPIEILYDNKPCKIKPQNSQITKKAIGSLSIYENLHNEKQLIISDDILSTSENPVQLNDVNNIDKIINHLVDETDLKDYNGIKIFLINSNSSFANSFEAKLARQNSNSYVLDLGLYQTRKKALDRFESLGKYYPKIKDFTYKANKIDVQGNILYNLLLYNVQDFKTALQICDKLDKEKQECVVVKLPQQKS
jgi:hypothetical protein